MREGSVFEPLDKRRKCTDYDKKLQESRTRRTMNSCIKLEQKVADLEKRIFTLEVFRELVKGVIVSIDLHGIDVKKQYPNLWAECINLKKEQSND